MTQEELMFWGVTVIGVLIALYILWIGAVKPTLAVLAEYVKQTLPVLGKHAEKIKVFFIAWIIVILINQIFIFGACFAPYCLAAALPHTSVISALITYLYFKNNQTDSN